MGATLERTIDHPEIGKLGIYLHPAPDSMQ
jgi:hypothetical protein